VARGCTPGNCNPGPSTFQGLVRVENQELCKIYRVPYPSRFVKGGDFRFHQRIYMANTGLPKKLPALLLS